MRFMAMRRSGVKIAQLNKAWLRRIKLGCLSRRVTCLLPLTNQHVLNFTDFCTHALDALLMRSRKSPMSHSSQCYMRLDVRCSQPPASGICYWWFAAFSAPLSIGRTLMPTRSIRQVSSSRSSSHFWI